jgi:hypothetical protein
MFIYHQIHASVVYMRRITGIFFTLKTDSESTWQIVCDTTIVNRRDGLETH